MKLLGRALLLAAAFSASASAIPGRNYLLEERADAASDVNNATAWSLIYGYPLLPFIQLMRPFMALAGPNKLFNEATTVNATNEVVVRPNVDTLYSGIALDLSNSNVEITIPEVSDGRFYVFPFYDVWGNNFANLGSVNDTKPGKYLVRPAATPDDNGYEAETDSSSDYLGYINYPTVYGICLIRILLLNNNTDVATVQALQKKIELATVDRDASPFDSAPTLEAAISNNLTVTDALISPGSLSTPTVDNLLNMLALVQPYAPPELVAYETTVNTTLAAAGIANGTYTAPEGLDMTKVEQLVNASLASILLSSSIYEQYGNGWEAFLPDISGNFGDNYVVRAYIAYIGYLQLDPYIAIYPIYNLSGATTSGLTVTTDQSVLFTFSGKPPVNGFWSLTAYGSDNYLIDNPLDVYAVGDRSNLTYPDGVLVYSDTDRDDEFQVLIQAADVAPPANWTGNWLPGPPGGGKFGVNLRYYGPTMQVENGTYVQPVVKSIDAIVDDSTASNSSSTDGSKHSSATTVGAGDTLPWAVVMTAVCLVAALL